VPQPIKKVNNSSDHEVIVPVQAHTDRMMDTVSIKACATNMMRRRSILSANAPASSDNSTTGIVIEAWTSATKSAESAIDVIIQDAPTA
jgi:hypothetical protein